MDKAAVSPGSMEAEAGTLVGPPTLVAARTLAAEDTAAALFTAERRGMAGRLGAIQEALELRAIPAWLGFSSRRVSQRRAGFRCLADCSHRQGPAQLSIGKTDSPVVAMVLDRTIEVAIHIVGDTAVTIDTGIAAAGVHMVMRRRTGTRTRM